jgi:hypothetical protein
MSGGPGLFALATGLVMGAILFALPEWSRDRTRRDHEARLADRLARGTDAYFEELRALKAYRPPRSLLLWRWGGAALFLLSAFLIVKRVTN